MASDERAHQHRRILLLSLLAAVLLLAWGRSRPAEAPTTRTAPQTVVADRASDQPVQDLAFPTAGRVVLLRWGGGAVYSVDGGGSWIEGRGKASGEDMVIGAPGELWVAHGWLGIHERDEASLDVSRDGGYTWTRVVIDPVDFVPQGFVSQDGATPVLSGRTRKGTALAHRSPATDGAAWADWQPVSPPSATGTDLPDGATLLGPSWATTGGGPRTATRQRRDPCALLHRDGEEWREVAEAICGQTASLGATVARNGEAWVAVPQGPILHATEGGDIRRLASPGEYVGHLAFDEVGRLWATCERGAFVEAAGAWRRAWP